MPILNLVWTIFAQSAPFKLKTFIRHWKYKGLCDFQLVANTVTEHIKMRWDGRACLCLWLCNKNCRKKGIKAWNCVNRWQSSVKLLCFEGKDGSVCVKVCMRCASTREEYVLARHGKQYCKITFAPQLGLLFCEGAVDLAEVLLEKASIF